MTGDLAVRSECLRMAALDGRPVVVAGTDPTGGVVAVNGGWEQPSLAAGADPARVAVDHLRRCLDPVPARGGGRLLQLPCRTGPGSDSRRRAPGGGLPLYRLPGPPRRSGRHRGTAGGPSGTERLT